MRAWLAALLALAAPLLASADEKPPLTFERSIALPKVRGRIDHLAIDAARQRLFVAALGNDTVEVVDLEKGEVALELGGFSEPQDVLFLAPLDRLFVSNGGTGVVDMLDGERFERIGRVELSADADNIRYDAATNRVYVGYGEGALAILDGASGRPVGDIAFTGHPESFQLESSGTRVFVNVPDAHAIVVLDRGEAAQVAAWRIERGVANFPMALDEVDHRLVVGFRLPAVLRLYDTASGAELGSLGSCKDADDIFLDAARHRVYVSCGEGVVDVLRLDGDRLMRLARVATAAGARTSLFVAERGILYVAVPRRGSQAAEVRVYRAAP